jgi:hypothetical protein
MSERRKSKSINVDELIRQVAINYFYKDGIFDTDIQPDELQEKIDDAANDMIILSGNSLDHILLISRALIISF